MLWTDMPVSAQHCDCILCNPKFVESYHKLECLHYLASHLIYYGPQIMVFCLISVSSISRKRLKAQSQCSVNICWVKTNSLKFIASRLILKKYMGFLNLHHCKPRNGKRHIVECSFHATRLSYFTSFVRRKEGNQCLLMTSHFSRICAWK